MGEITAGMVKTLRDKTGAGMMDCKAALAETKGNLEAAIDWLRKKGLSKAAKKAGRVAAEGLVGIAVAGREGALVEMNSETDFVARNADFQEMVRAVSVLGLAARGDLAALQAMPMPGGGKSVADTLTDLIARIGENMTLRRTAFLAVEEGVVAPYIHTHIAPQLGRIGVLVALRSKAPADKLLEFGRRLAMHIAATNPLALTEAGVAADVIAREKQIHIDQARQSGKPDAIVEKMAEGRMRKFFEEVVLLKQAYIHDQEKTVAQAIEAEGKTLGQPIAVEGFVRFALGEGIEKQETDFLAEVRAAAGV